MRRNQITDAALLTAVAGLAGCALFGGDHGIQVSEVRRLAVCNSPGAATSLSLFADPAAVADWQKTRGVDLIGAEPLSTAWVYVLVELGARDTGSYGLAVSRAAELDGGTARLSATFFEPTPGDTATPAPSSPCVLVALPPGKYTGLRLSDPSGATRAALAGIGAPPPVEQAAAPAAPAPPSEPPKN